MKKIIKKLVIILFIIINICTICTYSNAYSNKYIEIEFPKSYTIYENGTDTTQASSRSNNDFNSFVIVYEENSEKTDITSYSNTKIKEILKEFTEKLEESNIYNNIKQNKIEKTKIDKMNAIKAEYAGKIGNADMYMNIYLITSNKYIYFLMALTTSDNYFSSNEYNNIIKSIKIPDTTTSNKATFNEEINKEELADKVVTSILSVLTIYVIAYFASKCGKKQKSKNDTDKEEIKEVTEETNTANPNEEISKNENSANNPIINKDKDSNNNLI